MTSTATIARKILTEQAAAQAAAAREAETEEHRLAVQKDREVRVEARATRINTEFASITAILTKAGKISLVSGWIATAMSTQLTATSSAEEFRSAYNALRYAREWAKHPSRLKPARAGKAVTEPAPVVLDSTDQTDQVEPVSADTTPVQKSEYKTAIPDACLTMKVLNGRMEVLASRLTDDVKQHLDDVTLTLVTTPLTEPLTTLEAVKVYYALGRAFFHVQKAEAALAAAAAKLTDQNQSVVVPKQRHGRNGYGVEYKPMTPEQEAASQAALARQDLLAIGAPNPQLTHATARGCAIPQKTRREGSRAPKK